MELLKHFSLLLKSVNYGRKMFYRTCPKAFTIFFTKFLNYCIFLWFWHKHHKNIVNTIIYWNAYIFMQLSFNLSNGVTGTLESSSILIYLIQVKHIYMQKGRID
jgi:hypothetical protein